MIIAEDLHRFFESCFLKMILADCGPLAWDIPIGGCNNAFSTGILLPNDLRMHNPGAVIVHYIFHWLHASARTDCVPSECKIMSMMNFGHDLEYDFTIIYNETRSFPV